MDFSVYSLDGLAEAIAQLEYFVQEGRLERAVTQCSAYADQILLDLQNDQSQLRDLKEELDRRVDSDPSGVLSAAIDLTTTLFKKHQSAWKTALQTGGYAVWHGKNAMFYRQELERLEIERAQLI